METNVIDSVEYSFRVTVAYKSSCHVYATHSYVRASQLSAKENSLVLVLFIFKFH